MTSFQIVQNGFVVEPYKSKYGFESIEGQNTIRNISKNKKSVIVILSAECKPDLAHYHEVECFDLMNNAPINDRFPTQEEIEETLQSLAEAYEAE